MMLKIVSLGFLGEGLTEPMLITFGFAIQINLLLAVFNMFPVFPLDGSQVALGLLKGRALEIYEKHLPYGFYLILGLVVTGLLQKILAPILNFARQMVVFVYTMI